MSPLIIRHVRFLHELRHVVIKRKNDLCTLNQQVNNSFQYSWNFHVLDSIAHL